ncbi:MAG: 50S ribosomal protein L30 [Paludibacteraceae bacterium]|nr:50S ribosomal protein L30 [Paludibacteraceae bacterium]
MAKIKLQQVRSAIDCTKRQKANLEALGFKKNGTIIEKEDTPSVRGMLKVVGHLVIEVK